MSEIVPKIINIIPISRVKKIDTLSYFTLKNVQCGELVHISLAGNTIPGIVLEVNLLKATQKIGLKSVGYELKKLSTTSSRIILTKEMLSALQVVSEHFALHLCVLADLITSTKMLESNFQTPFIKHTRRKSQSSTKYIQDDYKSR